MATSINESNSNDSTSRSIMLMKVTLVPNALFIPLGALAIFFNILTTTIILTSKSLRTKCFLLLAANAFSDFLLGAGYMATGSLRVYRHLMGRGELVDMLRCCLEVCVITFAQLLSLGMALALVCDRLLATFFAQRYRQWTYKRLTVPLIICAYVFALAQLGVHFENAYQGREVILKSCGIEDTVFPGTLSVLTALQLSVSGGIVLLNCLLAIGVWKQKTKFTVAPVNASLAHQRLMAKQEADMKIVKAISAIVITHICTHLGGRLVIYFMAIYSDDLGKALTNRYGRELVVGNAAAHFFVLYAMSSQFRAATKKWFGNRVAKSPFWGNTNTAG